MPCVDAPLRQHWLDLRVPPPAVAALLALIGWAATRVWPALVVDGPWRWPVGLTALAMGVACDLSGLWAFRRHRTTINPMNPQATRALVRSGIYRYTRNPMYLGLAFLLTAWSALLGSPWAGLSVPVFVAWIGRFQIAPEERALRRHFGEAHVRYCREVRRWL